MQKEEMKKRDDNCPFSEKDRKEKKLDYFKKSILETNTKGSI